MLREGLRGSGALNSISTSTSATLRPGPVTISPTHSRTTVSAVTTTARSQVRPFVTKATPSAWRPPVTRTTTQRFPPLLTSVTNSASPQPPQPPPPSTGTLPTRPSHLLRPGPSDPSGPGGSNIGRPGPGSGLLTPQPPPTGPHANKTAFEPGSGSMIPGGAMHPTMGTPEMDGFFPGLLDGLNGEVLISETYRLGLWYGTACQQIAVRSECSTSPAPGILMNPALKISLTVSTWHSLRVETVIAVVFCLAGLVATVLGARPMFERLGRKRAVVITSVLCMVMSCILYLVAVSRVAALNQSLRAEFRDLGGEFVVYVPWSVVVGGIGACLAFVAASLQAFCAWYEERRKWAKFQNEVAFSNAEERNAPTAPPVSPLDISFDMANKGMQRETET